MNDTDPFAKPPDPNQVQHPPKGTRFDPDADTVPRDVLDRLRRGIDQGTAITLGESTVRAADSPQPSTVVESLQAQTDAMRDGRGVVHRVELNQPKAEVQEAEDFDDEKRKALVREVIGEGDKVTSLIEALEVKMRDAELVDDKIGDEVQDIKRKLQYAIDGLRPVQQQPGETPYEVMSMFRGIEADAKQLLKDADTMLSGRTRAIGDGSDYRESAEKMSRLQMRVRSESPEGSKDKLAQDLLNAVSVLDQAAQTRGYDLSVVNDAQDISEHLTKVANNLQYEGTQSVTTRQIERIIDDLDVIMQQVTNSQRVLGDSKQGVALARSSLERFI